MSEIEFDADDVAMITSENKPELTTWHINCWPEEVCCMYVQCSTNS